MQNTDKISKICCILVEGTVCYENGRRVSGPGGRVLQVGARNASFAALTNRLRIDIAEELA
jgi:hypothetical protein